MNPSGATGRGSHVVFFGAAWLQISQDFYHHQKNHLATTNCNHLSGVTVNYLLLSAQLAASTGHC